MLANQEKASNHSSPSAQQKTANSYGVSAAAVPQKANVENAPTSKPTPVCEPVAKDPSKE